MVIDFEKIAEAHLEGFKGGKGKLDTRNYVDDKVKIMYSTLRPGASTGLHTHEGNCEIIYVVSGTATFHYDDTVEEVRQGQVHYCPMNHAHYMENLTDHDLVYLAIVPETSLKNYVSEVIFLKFRTCKGGNGNHSPFFRVFETIFFKSYVLFQK